ncbi:MAG: GNAT family N-acetyltransferase [Flammeovirgaceae bacterium]|nr:GNAT family N-acetyltransferase [Flammeovirgaceae bacterium]
MSLLVQKIIEDKSTLEEAFKIRFKVFVEGQNVPAEEELDQFENEATHFLAYLNGKPVGTARWRFTPKGIKLERFAVLNECQGEGVGAALINEVLEDVRQNPVSKGKMRYLHGQVEVEEFYKKFGFTSIGEPFDECGIMHYLMTLEE